MTKMQALLAQADLLMAQMTMTAICGGDIQPFRAKIVELQRLVERERLES